MGVLRRTGWDGLVLTGGRSSRMGSDKAFVEIDGVPMVVRVRTALRDGGAADVRAVGGDAQRLRALGFTVWEDGWPGEGPLGALATVAAGTVAHPDSVLVAAACDLPALTGVGVRALTDDLAHSSALAAVPVVDGTWQSHLVAFRYRGLAALAEEFARGKRSLWKTLSTMDVIESTSVDPAELVDLDSPEDVADYARRSGEHAD